MWPIVMNESGADTDVVAYPLVLIQGFLKIKAVRHGRNYNPAGPTG